MTFVERLEHCDAVVAAHEHYEIAKLSRQDDVIA
jgi:hypothetical protein